MRRLYFKENGESGMNEKEEISEINKEYDEYCKSQTKSNHALPFIIWLKYKKKVKPSSYYGESEELE